MEGKQFYYKIDPEAGRRVKIVRERAKMSRTELAKRCFVSQPLISSVESGARRLTDPLARSIGEVCGVRPGYLLCYDDCATEEEERLKAGRLSVVQAASDAVEELTAALKASFATNSGTIVKAEPGWISTKERLPDVNQPIMICIFGIYVGEGKYCGHDGYHDVWKRHSDSGTYWDDEVTHWLPLPEPPKEVER